MPKMYRVMKGGSWTWDYFDDDTKRVLAESRETWDTPEQADAAIEEMKKAKVKRVED